MSRPRLFETQLFQSCWDRDQLRLKNFQVSRPRLIESGKYRGCRDWDWSRLDKSCRDWDFDESLAILWPHCMQSSTLVIILSISICLDMSALCMIQLLGNHVISFQIIYSYSSWNIKIDGGNLMDVSGIKLTYFIKLLKDL